jgi:hypothetical protein
VFFRATCSQVKIKPLELLLWIRTRWGSLFTFLERFIQLKAVRELYLLILSDHYITCNQAVTQFTLLTDESTAVPSLTNRCSYSDFHLTQKDWEHLVDIRDALRVSHLNLCASLLTTVRSHRISSRHSQVCERQRSGTLSQVSNSLSSVGKAWPLIKNIIS